MIGTHNGKKRFCLVTDIDSDFEYPRTKLIDVDDISSIEEYKKSGGKFQNTIVSFYTSNKKVILREDLKGTMELLKNIIEI